MRSYCTSNVTYNACAERCGPANDGGGWRDCRLVVWRPMGSNNITYAYASAPAAAAAVMHQVVTWL